MADEAGTKVSKSAALEAPGGKRDGQGRSAGRTWLTARGGEQRRRSHWTLPWGGLGDPILFLATGKAAGPFFLPCAKLFDSEGGIAQGPAFLPLPTALWRSPGQQGQPHLTAALAAHRPGPPLAGQAPRCSPHPSGSELADHQALLPAGLVIPLAVGEDLHTVL